MIRRPPRSTLFPYPPLSRSDVAAAADAPRVVALDPGVEAPVADVAPDQPHEPLAGRDAEHRLAQDRKSTRLNSSHANISYAVFCLKKKTNNTNNTHPCQYYK